MDSPPATLQDSSDLGSYCRGPQTERCGRLWGWWRFGAAILIVGSRQLLPAREFDHTRGSCRWLGFGSIPFYGDLLTGFQSVSRPPFSRQIRRACRLQVPTLVPRSAIRRQVNDHVWVVPINAGNCSRKPDGFACIEFGIERMMGERWAGCEDGPKRSYCESFHFRCPLSDASALLTGPESAGSLDV
jgi:hypothetical protein